MELIEKYFGGELTPLQRERFVRLYDLYAEWNARINVVSRKDFDSLYLKHVLHSLAIACACRFDGGAQVCDVGTGGGFPAVPHAILLTRGTLHRSGLHRQKDYGGTGGCLSPRSR